MLGRRDTIPQMQTTVTIDWTLVIAIYGAFAATATLAWDFWKWKSSGPSLEVTLSTGMRSYNVPAYEGKALMLLNVTNRGDRATTITHVGIHRYESTWRYLRRRPSASFIAPTPNIDFPPPHVLEPGKVWMGILEQSDDIVEMAKTGMLYVGLTHSHAKRPIRRRVVISSD